MTEKVALLDSINQTAFDAFDDAGFEIHDFPKNADPSELADLTDDAAALGVRSGPKITAEAMGENLEVIGVYGSGTSHIERKTADRRGADDRAIAILNASHENTRSVAEMVMGCTIALSRDFHGHDRSMQSGTYSKKDGKEVLGKTLGIIGHGVIGGQVSVLAQSMSMDVLAYDPINKTSVGRVKHVDNIEELLEGSDFVTLHAPGAKSNRHLINERTLKLMKPGSFLINAARADLVDYEALINSLDENHLAGAAIDVYTDEAYTEPEKGQPFEHILRDHPKVFCTPHIGGSTAEAQAQIGRSVALKTIGYLATGTSLGSVNIPDLQLNGIEPGTSRLLSIHDNHPGVMAELTQLLAEHSLNVRSTEQRVKGEIGYVAFDVEGVIEPESLIAIRSMQATRRAKVLR